MNERAVELISEIPFNESTGLTLYGETFQYFGEVLLRSGVTFNDTALEVQFDVFTRQNDLVKLPIWPGVYVFAQRSADSLLHPKYVGKGFDIAVRLSDYSIQKSGERFSSDHSRRIKNMINEAINDKSAHGVSLWLANCTSGSPCFTGLENRILRNIRLNWNIAEDNADLEHCSWCTIQYMLKMYYIDCEDSLTTIATNLSKGIGKQLDKPVDVCKSHSENVGCVECTFARLQRAFKHESAENNARSRKMKTLIDEFITANNYQAFFR